MASKPSLDNRLARMEAIAAREAGATEGEFSLRILRAWSTPDLKRLEGILERVESGDAGAAITAAEQAWVDENMKHAKVIAGAPSDLAKRLLELEMAGASETGGGRKLDLGWLTKEERGRLRTILIQVKAHVFTHTGLNALSTADVAWLTELGNRESHFTSSD